YIHSMLQKAAVDGFSVWVLERLRDEDLIMLAGFMFFFLRRTVTAKLSAVRCIFFYYSSLLYFKLFGHDNELLGYSTFICVYFMVLAKTILHRGRTNDFLLASCLHFVSLATVNILFVALLLHMCIIYLGEHHYRLYSILRVHVIGRLKGWLTKRGVCLTKTILFF
ncbi:hypothetical protein ACJX0J_022051, partial [Zea mays]